MRGTSGLLRRLALLSSSTLNGYSETAVRTLSTGADLKSILAEKIPAQQVRLHSGISEYDGTQSPNQAGSWKAFLCMSRDVCC